MDYQVRTSIEGVLVGTKSTAKLPRLPLTQYEDFFKSIEGVDEVEYESNGYQVDFWMTFKLGSSSYKLSGDLWYEPYWQFYRVEEN